MKNWENEKKNNIVDHIVVTHVIFIFTFFMALLTLVKESPNNAASFPMGIYTLTIISLTGAAIILYIGKKLVEGVLLAGRPNSTDILLFLFSFVIAISTLVLTGKSDSPVKVIFIIPVIIVSTTYGKTYGLAMAGVASAILFFFDFSSGLESTPSVKFQTDIVNSTVMLTLAWLIGGLADIEKGVREKLTTLANTDELTGLSNHRHFQEMLRHYLNTAKANNSPLSMIMFDIDHFKFYNDHFGHQKGDEVLQEIGSLVNEHIKKPNFTARYGGEEFSIIVPDYEQKAMEIAENLRHKIEAYPFEGAEIQPKGKITVSLGVASYPLHGSSPKEIIRAADEALYKAKYSRNKVQLYFSVMDDLRDGIAETERDLFNSVKTLITIINAKDRYTFAHSERVLYYSIKLAEQLRLSEEEMTYLRYGSFLHDIGKIEVDRDLLNKVGPLKPNEWSILKKHPAWGSDIVRPISSLKKVIPAILHHHENYDGTGYPAELSGEDIPLQARILRIADSFDAMTTDRPYKKAKTVLEACKELEKGSGTLFDPVLVELFVRFILKENCEHPAFKSGKAII